LLQTGDAPARLGVSSRELYRSKDSGASWERLADGDFDAVYASDGADEVVVGADGVIYSSRDGFQWTRRYSGFASRNLRSVVYANGLFTAVGNNDSILQSGNVLPRLTGALQPGGLEITLRGETNRAYAIEVSSNLDSWHGVHVLTNTAAKPSLGIQEKRPRTLIPTQTHALSAKEFGIWLTCHRISAISGDHLSAVISTRYSFGFRKHNSNVFNMLVKNLPITSDIKCVCY